MTYPSLWRPAMQARTETFSIETTFDIHNKPVNAFWALFQVCRLGLLGAREGGEAPQLVDFPSHPLLDAASNWRRDASLGEKRPARDSQRGLSGLDRCSLCRTFCPCRRLLCT